MNIQFTQYLLPHGNTKIVYIDRPDDIGKMAQELTSGDKYRLECEMLSTGEVSFTCFDTVKEEDIAIQISLNGPAVKEAVDNLIKEAYSLVIEDE